MAFFSTQIQSYSKIVRFSAGRWHARIRMPVYVLESLPYLLSEV